MEFGCDSAEKIITSGKRLLMLLILLYISNECYCHQLSSSYPFDWQSAPSSIQDYPLREINGRKLHVMNPWHYLDRLGVFRIIVTATEKYFIPWGYNNTGNILWGLPLQFSWQMTTGRLLVSTHSQPITFSAASWWADMNYYLSIIPFLGAVNAGLIPQPKNPFYILSPTNVSVDLRDKFCTSVTQCQSRHPDLMQKWTEFFSHVRRKKKDSVDDMDVTVGLMWDAHITSIRTAEPMFENELYQLPDPEMHFGRGWALLVDFIAATQFQTNMNNTYEQQVIALPPRILHSGDHPPYIRDITKIQNNALTAINMIYKAQKLTEGGFLYIWKKAMCSDKGKADGRDMLENILEHPITVLKDLIKLVIDFIKDHDC